MKLKVNDLVKIKFDVLELKLIPYAIEEIKEFDEEHDGVHKITRIISKGKFYKNNKGIPKYELDDSFVFYEEELEKIKR